MSTTNTIPTPALVRLPDPSLRELDRLIREADSVELKFTVPDGAKRSTLRALGVDLHDADARHVYFFDTPDLALDRQGVVVRGRDCPRDSVVKLRPASTDAVASDLRGSKRLRVEVDAMPGGYVSSASLKYRSARAELPDVVAGRRPLRKLFSKQQRAFYAAHAPTGLALDDLSVLGPVHVLKLKTVPAGFDRKLAVELWRYPDGARLLELSIRCRPDEAFQVATATASFFDARRLSLATEPQPKTRRTLEYFATRIDAPRAGLDRRRPTSREGAER